MPQKNFESALLLRDHRCVCVETPSFHVFSCSFLELKSTFLDWPERSASVRESCWVWEKKDFAFSFATQQMAAFMTVLSETDNGINDMEK